MKIGDLIDFDELKRQNEELNQEKLLKEDKEFFLDRD